MPSTPEKKLARNRLWRRGRTPGYYEWLYQRRKLRFDKAAEYEKLLRELAADGFDDGWPPHAVKAQELLETFERRERKLGNHYDHEGDRGVWVIE